MNEALGNHKERASRMTSGAAPSTEPGCAECMHRGWREDTYSPGIQQDPVGSYAELRIRQTRPTGAFYIIAS
jgi:hypothetical protein